MSFEACALRTTQWELDIIYHILRLAHQASIPWTSFEQCTCLGNDIWLLAPPHAVRYSLKSSRKAFVPFKQLETLASSIGVVRPTWAICRASSSSSSIFLQRAQNSFLSDSASSRHTRLKLARDSGSMIFAHFSRRTSLYLSKMLSSALPSFKATRASKRLPTSAIPPVKPRPPLYHPCISTEDCLKDGWYLQGIAQMGCISRQQEASNPKRVCTSLMQLVWTGTDEFIVLRLRMTRQDLLESFRLSLEILFIR